ncbi:MAG TPA: hypothetical protein VJT75_12670 [Thermoleophilaceae bacterium]|nr:hypothetical protein [Thermoleophilaceae bacterium]
MDVAPARPWLAPALLFAGAALIAGFTLLRGVDPFDEGLMLSAARRVADGQLPYDDFLWSYGPGQPYLLAALQDLFGASLLWWRLLWMLATAGTAVVAYALVRPSAGPRWALASWLAVACALAQPRTANPFPFALLAAMGALLVVTRDDRSPRSRAVAAGLLLAVAAAFRLDFALYGAAAVVVTLGLSTCSVRPALECAAVAIGGALLAYIPFAVAVGPGDLYDSLVATSLRERDYWTLPFPWSYGGSVASPKGLKHLLDFYVPALLLAGVAVGAAATLVRALRDRRLPPAWSGLVVFGVGSLSYLLSRTDEFHTLPLIAVLAVLLPLAAAWGRRREEALGRALAAAAALVFALLLVHGVANRASALLRPESTSALRVGPADGVRARPEEARALERVVAFVHRRVPAGEPIYVAPARSDLVRFTNPLVYVAADRDNATDRDHGLIARAGTQRRIVRQLERARPRVVVRWTDPIGSRREPNLRGRPSGVHLLDDWLRRNYRLAERLFHYDLLVPR